MARVVLFFIKISNYFRPMTRSMTKTVEVHFHVLVLKQLVRDPYADSIIVSFRDTFSGRWKDLHYKLFPKE